MLGGCDAATQPAPEVTIQRTTHGIAHIEAPDYESLAYGVAYAHAADNVCQTANQLVTIRGERSRFFGADESALLGLRVLPNPQIDIFIRAHMDDAALAHAQAGSSAEAQALARGYVAGYNRYLDDHAGSLPATCADAPWVRPMTAADYLRLQELTMVQLGVALLADAVVAASPPEAGEAAAPVPDPEQAAQALAPLRLDDPVLGSNGWAFGSEVTANGRGVLLGNPHFPWSGVNRFWEMHLTIPGQLDVMGASIGHSPVVQIGFNKDVAWTHTVSTGKRFTLYELQLAEGEPTSYIVDGESVAMTPEAVTFEVRTADGGVVEKTHTVWGTQFGPVIEYPDAGLSWTGTHAYALQDANALNLRAMEIWIGFNRASSVDDMIATLGELGVPWVNTIAADRQGQALYADVSVVPDVDAEQLRRCAPSEHAAALFQAAGLVVLDGSRSECGWQQDPESPVPGLIPMERMPVAVRRDFVQNSNDSFWMSNPDIDWPPFSPLVGLIDVAQSLRTRAGLYAIRTRLAAEDAIAEHGKIGLDEVQAMLFANRNQAAYLVLDDLLALCDPAVGARPTDDMQLDPCTVLQRWDRHNNLDSRGEPLFREWWRAARNIENVWDVPFDPEHPATTPSGLNTGDPAVRTAVLAALDSAYATVQASGYAPDAPLGDVQYRRTADGRVGLHGGPEFEGLLNKVETATDTLTEDGYPVQWGSSYIQTVTFDERGPVAEAIMVYGQSSEPGSPYAFDQLEMFAEKDWMPLPFHPEDIAEARIGEVLRLTVR
ncbi:MAG TPA: acylase [Woeseiaceae bacterium]|nr:acylase [Woeseiaceae bacterium]